MSDVLIRAEAVSKKFCRSLKKSLWYGAKDSFADLVGASSSTFLRPDEFWAVADVSFEVRRGECLGLVGRNGAGKTTLLKMLNGLIKPDSGRIEMRGRVCALIALGAGFNPLLTGRENVYVNGSILGLTKKEIARNFDEIVDFAEIEQFIDAPVQSYSSGMQVRLGFAVATALQPDVLLLDEVLAVGDANFQAKCYHRIGRLLERAAIILVSHQSYHIRKICDAVALLEGGRLLQIGPTKDVLQSYADLIASNQTEVGVELLGDGVIGADILGVIPRADYGEKIEFTLRLDLEKALTCDQAYVNIVDNSGNVHAQAIIDNLPMSLKEGMNTITFSIGPLFLSRGRFSISIIMWTMGGKKSLAQLRNSFTIINEGPVNLGPFYYPPAAAIVIPEQISIDARAELLNDLAN